MVVFDATMLMFVLDDNAKASMPNARERVEYLIDCLSKENEKIVDPDAGLERMPGPCRAGRSRLSGDHHQEGGVPGRQLRRACRRRGCRSHLGGAAARAAEGRQAGGGKAKIKFDRQIVAIAKVEGATAVYSDDVNVIAYAREAAWKAIAWPTCRSRPKIRSTPCPWSRRTSSDRGGAAWLGGYLVISLSRHLAHLLAPETDWQRAGLPAC